MEVLKYNCVSPYKSKSECENDKFAEQYKIFRDRCNKLEYI